MVCVGGLNYERRETSRGIDLQVPFQSGTFNIKEALRSLGFRCAYSDHVWRLDSASPDKEAALRFLLETGELPDPHTPTAGTAEARTPVGQERSKRPREAEEEEEPRSFHDGAVTLRQEADGHAVLEGLALRHIRPMLESILHFQQLQAPGSEAWRSAWPLTHGERQFVEAVVEHRRQRLLDGTVDDKQPIPPDCTMPRRFIPRDGRGQLMRGPFTARHGLPHNRGRQFFSSWEKDSLDSFRWADGTGAFSDHAQDRFDAWADGGGLDALFVGLSGILFGGGAGGGFHMGGGQEEEYGYDEFYDEMEGEEDDEEGCEEGEEGEEGED